MCDDGLCVGSGEGAQQGGAVEKAGVEEVGRLTTGFEGEGTEFEDRGGEAGLEKGGFVGGEGGRGGGGERGVG